MRQSWLSSIFTTLNALTFSFPVVLQEKPDLVSTYKYFLPLNKISCSSKEALSHLSLPSFLAVNAPDFNVVCFGSSPGFPCSLSNPLTLTSRCD